jgi:hypothetical protein
MLDIRHVPATAPVPIGAPAPAGSRAQAEPGGYPPGPRLHPGFGPGRAGVSGGRSGSGLAAPVPCSRRLRPPTRSRRLFPGRFRGRPTGAAAPGGERRPPLSAGSRPVASRARFLGRDDPDLRGHDHGGDGDRHVGGRRQRARVRPPFLSMVRSRCRWRTPR